jgi:uncharacterized membrane protein YhaH (DUF805 family)
MKRMFLPFRRYAEFKGRSQRLEYWMFTLFNAIVFGLLNLLVTAVGPTPLLVYSAAVLIPGTAVTVRRFHDVGLSGWWLMAALIPGVAGLLGTVSGIFAVLIDSGASGAVTIDKVAGPVGDQLKWTAVGLLVTNIIVLVVLLLPGTVGANRFGADPRGSGLGDKFS